MEIKNLAAALVKAQAAMTGAKKDSSNPFFKSKYADLSSVDAAIGPALEANGLGYVQVSHVADSAASVETIIIHESGETFACGPVTVPVSKGDAQAFGSAMTYARRYSLAAAFGVCPEDDDGNAAAKAAPKTIAQESQPSGKILPNDAGKELWGKSEGEEKELLNKALSVVRDFLNTGNAKAASHHFYFGSKLDIEEQAAVWSQLTGSERKIVRANKEEKQ